MGLRNSVNNVGFLWYSFAKNFVRTQSTILYGRVSECLRQNFSFLFSSSFKSGLRFYTKLHKKKKSFVVKHSLKEREREKKEHFFTSQ